MAVHETTLCSLAAAVGKQAACPSEACPFWEPGGAALEGRCALDRIGLHGDAELATWLLEIRGRLETTSSVEEELALRAAFHQLLNGSDE